MSIITTTPQPVDGGRPDRLRFLGLPKFAGLIGVVGALIALLAYLNDLGVFKTEPGAAATPPPASSAPAPTTAPTTAPATGPTTGATSARPAGGSGGSFRLAAERIDARTVEVALTPPASLNRDRQYWFVLEVDWRNGNTDYYPRARLTGDEPSLVVDIPPGATLDADRAGRVYALTAAEGSQAATLLRRQTQPTGDDEDFFAERPGAAASGAVLLPFGG